MKPAAIWSFIAGDSRLAPLGVALAVIVTFALVRYAPGAGFAIGAIFVGLLAASLVAGVFEKT